MRHLRPLDKAQLAILLPLWALCFGLTLKAVVRDTAIPLVYAAGAENPDSYPTLTGFVPSLATHEGALRIGDRLIRVGNADLRGTDLIGFRVAVAGEVGANRRVSVLFEHGGQRREISLPVRSYAMFGPALLASLVSAIAAVIVLLRVRQSPMARVIFQGLMALAFLYANVFGGSRAEEYLAIVVLILSSALVQPLLFRSALIFPENVPPRSRWGRWGPWCFLVLGPLHASRMYGFPLAHTVAAPLAGVVSVLFYVTVLFIVTRTYRRADRIARRQMKWLLFGIYCAAIPGLIASALAGYDPRFDPLFALSESAAAFFPASLLIAIAWYNFLDIDRLLSATASFNIVVFLLVGVILIAVPLVADAAAAHTGLDPSSGRIILSLLVAATVVPAHRRLRPQIDRIFFAQRYALEQGIGQLLDELSTCGGARELIRLLGDRLDVLLRPESCAIYMRGDQVYFPVFARGRAVPPAFEAGRSLVAALRERGAPLGEGLPGARRGPELSRFDRAALDTLGVAVVVPIRLRGEITAFACVGPKRSEDVYTSTDLAFLRSIADKVSSELLRYDQADVIRQSRAMQESLRRYVPGAVADELARGGSLEDGECEVAVLFVDIHGYTSYSESRRAEEIFSTVNRYTETVSKIVRLRGGSVVEFNGDGMMAVFGAPRSLPNKERLAVEAGREIVRAVETLRPGAGDEALSVGVGIATGEAFVGNIRAADRLIWTAIGNTTNLAARLQGLTRDLNASLVIDATTHDGAGDARRGFSRKESAPIRGRRQRADVYLLPLPARL